VVRCFGFALRQAHFNLLGFGLWLRESAHHGNLLAHDGSVRSHNSVVQLVYTTSTIVIQFQYVARHSRHSFVDATKFHLQSQSLYFALSIPLHFTTTAEV
jgi:hypothetical protein